MFESKKKKKDLTEFLEDWPAHYYEIEDVNQREEVLKARLKEHPDSADDQRRLDVLHARFGKHKMDKRPDHFIHACLMMRVLSNTKVSSLNRRSMMRDYQSCLNELGVSVVKEPDDILKAEWRDFADDYIETCMSSFSKPQFLGVAKRDEHTAMQHVAEDINIITKVLPSQLGMEKAVKPVRQIMIEEFINTFEDGEEIWNAYFGSEND